MFTVTEQKKISVCRTTLIYGTATDAIETPTAGPGCFGISLLKGLSKQSAAVAMSAGPVVSYDLGKIKGSTAFYFLLSNVGKSPITNVTFSADNQAFSVYPSVIDSLMPGNNVSIMPIVKIVAYHGTAYEGAGFR